jgi:YgiT-type zinc finger domain-containing protein
MKNNAREAQVRCENCGRDGIHLRHVTRSYGKGAGLLVVENVPVISCPHCGVSYLTAETLHEIERIKAHRRSLAPPRNVAVAKFLQQSEEGGTRA